MKLKALIVDDEPLAHEIIVEYAADIDFIDIVEQCYKPTDAINYLNQHKVDLVFLDIQMPRLKGLDLLRTLRHPPIVIITSAYEEYALESYELDVCDYLLKPFRFDRFLKATNKALQLYQLKQPQQTQKDSNTIIPKEDEPIIIKTDKRLIQLQMNAIFYLESFGNYVKIWTENQFYLTPRTLSSFEEQLENTSFSRVHRSFIINRHHFKFLEGNTIRLANQSRIPIGKNYKNDFLKILES